MALSSLLNTELDDEGYSGGGGTGTSRVHVLQAAINTIKENRIKIQTLEATVKKLKIDLAEATATGDNRLESQQQSPSSSTGSLSLSSFPSSAATNAATVLAQQQLALQTLLSSANLQLQADPSLLPSQSSLLLNSSANYPSQVAQTASLNAQMLSLIAANQAQFQQQQEVLNNLRMRDVASAPPTMSAAGAGGNTAAGPSLAIQPQLSYVGSNNLSVPSAHTPSSRHSRNNSGSSFHSSFPMQQPSITTGDHAHASANMPSSPHSAYSTSSIGSRKRTYSNEHANLPLVSTLAMPSQSRGTSESNSVSSGGPMHSVDLTVEVGSSTTPIALNRPPSLPLMSQPPGPAPDLKRRRTGDSSPLSISTSSSLSASPSQSPMVRPLSGLGGISPRGSMGMGTFNNMVMNHQVAATAGQLGQLGLGGSNTNSSSAAGVGPQLGLFLGQQNAFLLSLDGQVLEVSDRFADVFGATSDQFVGQSLFALLHPSESVATLTSIQTLLRGTNDDGTGGVEDAKRLFLRHPLSQQGYGAMMSSSSSSTIAMRLVLFSVIQGGRLSMLLGVVTPWDAPPSFPIGFQGSSSGCLELLQQQASHLLEASQQKYLVTVLYGVPKSRLTGGSGVNSHGRNAVRHSLTQPLTLPQSLASAANVGASAGSIMRPSHSHQNLTSLTTSRTTQSPQQAYQQLSQQSPRHYLQPPPPSQPQHQQQSQYSSQSQVQLYSPNPSSTQFQSLPVPSSSHGSSSMPLGSVEDTNFSTSPASHPYLDSTPMSPMPLSYSMSSTSHLHHHHHGADSLLSPFRPMDKSPIPMPPDSPTFSYENNDEETDPASVANIVITPNSPRLENHQEQDQEF